MAIATSGDCQSLAPSKGNNLNLLKVLWPNQRHPNDLGLSCRERAFGGQVIREGDQAYVRIWSRQVLAFPLFPVTIQPSLEIQNPHRGTHELLVAALRRCPFERDATGPRHGPARPPAPGWQ